LGLTTARKLTALEYVNSIIRNRYAAKLYPKDRQESEVVNDEKPEVWGGLADKYLPHLTTGRQEWGGAFDEVGSFYRFCFSHILYIISSH
jgi:hypothetical protein